MRLIHEEYEKLFQSLRETAIEYKKPDSLPFRLIPTELVMNISEGCNLTCPYCFAGQGLYGSDKPQWMSSENAFDISSQALRQYPSLETIKLFGGEPFMNVRAIQGVCRAVEEELERCPERRIVIGTVTNMTIFSPVLVELIKRHNIRITVSIDGPQDIHDRYRVFRNGKGSYRRICDNIQRYRGEGIKLNAFESVYTPFEMERGISIGDIVDFLINEFDAQWVHVVPDAGAYADDSAEQTKFASQLQQDVFALYRSCVSSDFLAKKDLAREVLRMMFTPHRVVPWCGLGQSQITAAADGTIYPCYMMLGNRSEWKMANDISILCAAGVPSPIEHRLSQASASVVPDCDACLLREVCRGCPGGELQASGQLARVNPIRCAFNLGCVEGVLAGWKDRTAGQSLVA